MKLFNAICFVFLTVGAACAQEIDERLLTKYSQVELESLVAKDVESYTMLVYALDNALYVSDYSSVKSTELQTIVVDSSELPTFADLQLDILDVNQYFKIQGEDKVLVVKSTWVLNHELSKR